MDTVSSIKKYKKIVILSDIHMPFHDVKTLLAVRKFIKKEQPDILILNGDIMDQYNSSVFDKHPMRTQGGLQREFDIAHAVIKFLVSVVPKAKKIYLWGNHEYRFWRQMFKDPNLYSLKSVNFESCLKLKELGIQFETKAVLLHGLLLKHGIKCGKFPASNELEAEDMTGCSGHAHKLQMFMRNTRENTYSWVSTGHLADTKQLDYVRVEENTINWTQGFCVAYSDGKKVFQTPVPIIKNTFVFNNIEYVATDSDIKEYNAMIKKLPTVDSYYD